MEQVSNISEPTSMEELYNTLYELGAIWREEHQYTVNEGKKNEKIVIPIPEVSTVAKYLRQVCHFAFISRVTVRTSHRYTCITTTREFIPIARTYSTNYVLSLTVD